MNSLKKDFLVYYRAWRDVEMKGVNSKITGENWISMKDIPYGINYVNVFSYVPEGEENLAKPYFDKLKNEYGPELHKRGVKIIRGFDYSRLLGVKAKGDIPTEEEFDAYAKELLDLLMTPWNLDGLDVDMETDPTPEQVLLSDGVIKALSKYIGPKANNGTVFFYDTNNSNLDPIKNVRDCFDHVAYQQYGSKSDRTKRAANDFSAILPTTKFMPGLTFPEEGDKNNRWYDTDFDYEKSHIYDIATAVKENNLNGMFLYAPDRDGRTYTEPDMSSILPSNLLWTKTAVQEVNGWTLERAQQAAKHHLKRIAEAKQLSEDIISKTIQAIENSKNLLEVNIALLGKDYPEAISPTYDAVLEEILSEIDLTEAYKLLEETKGNLPDKLAKRRNKLVSLMSKKEYSQKEIIEAIEDLKVSLI